MPIQYLRGDATCPQVPGPKIIPHIVNDQGKWGAGFVLAISKRWSGPEAYYRQWYNLRKIEGMVLQNPMKGSFVSTTGDFELGAAQLVQVYEDTYVANMIAQAGTRTGSKGPPIRYDALASALEKVDFFAEMLGASVHAPRIGCSLAGGRWSLVEPIIRRTLVKRDVYIYDFAGSVFNS